LTFELREGLACTHEGLRTGPPRGRHPHRHPLLRGARRPAAALARRERDLQRVRMFHTLRSLGLSLAESARLADMCADGACEEMDGELLPQLGRRRAEIAAARAELDHLDTQLAGLEDAIRAGRFREQSCACNHEEGDATCASCQC
jgi:DNA-binding transcriptional MerR regulator